MRTAVAAYRDGLGRVARAPAILAGLVAFLLVLTTPAAWIVRDAIERALGGSLVAGELLRGFDLAWWHEFRAGAAGLAADFGPWVIGGAVMARNLSDLAGARAASPASWMLVAAWIVGGTILSGGILDRYARQRPIRSHGFGAACGRLAFRMLRLNALVWLLYWIVASASVAMGGVIGWVVEDAASERAELLWRALLLALTGLIVAAITIVADASRVRLVVEDRRSALFALVAGLRFARRTGGAIVTLYALLIATTLALFLVYAMAAPGARGAGVAVWAGFAVGQLYIVARVFTKLLTYASMTALFQAALAHAEYVAQPTPVWPDAPAVETLGPHAADAPDAAH